MHSQADEHRQHDQAKLTSGPSQNHAQVFANTDSTVSKARLKYTNVVTAGDVDSSAEPQEHATSASIVGS